MFIDITRAHPHCSMRLEVCIQPPSEDLRSGDAIAWFSDPGMSFGQLTREGMNRMCFTCVLGSPRVLAHREKNMQVYVYGDNFVSKGLRRELYQFFNELETRMLAKNGVLGLDPSQGDFFRNCLLEPCVFRWSVS